MTIKDIYFNYNISELAYNICVVNNIETTSELKEYYTKYGSFKSIHNCNDKTNLELISICIKYFNETEDEGINSIKTYEFTIQNRTISLDRNQINKVNFYIKENFSQLSRRTQNGLARHLEGEININGLANNILSKQFFKPNTIINLGEKSILELQTYLKEVEEYIITIYNVNDENDIFLEMEMVFGNNNKKGINNLNDIQRQIINHHVNIQFSKLSNRCKNGLNSFLEKQINIDKIADKIFLNTGFNFKSIENIGLATFRELELFSNSIKLFANEVIEIDEEEKLTELNLKFFLIENFKNLDINQDIIPKNSIFSIIQFLTEKEALFGKNENYIFKNGLLIYKDFIPQNLEQLSKNTYLTKERCRQIRVKLLEQLQDKLAAVRLFGQSFFTKYNFDLDAPIIYINDDIASQINTLDETNFSKHFITFICSFFYKNEYKLIGDSTDVMITKDFTIRTRYTWRNLFLISFKLSETFDFRKFIEDIDKRTLESINETYKINVRNFISIILKSDDPILLEEIFPICKMLLIEELGINLDNEENIIFERNSYKTLPEYAYEALEILGKPSHIDDINNQIKILKPDYNNAISSSILTRAMGFVPYGRASIFGLKKWDDEKENIKGGTIREIVQEFLENQPNPVHIKKITEYVLKYRPESNEYSITQNLKLEDNNRFIFYKSVYVGLESKKQEYYENSMHSSYKTIVNNESNSSKKSIQKPASSDQTNLDFPEEEKSSSLSALFKKISNSS